MCTKVIKVADVSKTTVYVLLVITVLVSVLGVLTVLQVTTTPKLDDMATATPVFEDAGTVSIPEGVTKPYESDATISFTIGERR